MSPAIVSIVVDTNDGRKAMSNGMDINVHLKELWFTVECAPSGDLGSDKWTAEFTALRATRFRCFSTRRDIDCASTSVLTEAPSVIYSPRNYKTSSPYPPQSSQHRILRTPYGVKKAIL